MNWIRCLPFLGIALFFAPRALGRTPCTVVYSGQLARLEAFEREHPLRSEPFAYTAEPTSASPINRELNASTVLNNQGFLKQGAAFVLLEGEEQLRIGLSHSLGGFKPAWAAGDIKAIFDSTTHELSEVWINLQSGGYFRNAKNPDGSDVQQEQIIGSTARAVRALWQSGIFPNKIKIFYSDYSGKLPGSETGDPRFFKRVAVF